MCEYHRLDSRVQKLTRVIAMLEEHSLGEDIIIILA